jgi:hypothetical protein
MPCMAGGAQAAHVHALLQADLVLTGLITTLKSGWFDHIDKVSDTVSLDPRQ